jgi:hypothetical protein
MGNSSQTIGSFVIKSGAKTGLTLGEVVANTSTYNRASTYSETGDSGSPIFYESGGNASLYGMVFGRIWNNFYQRYEVLYFPWDYIGSNIGAYPP